MRINLEKGSLKADLDICISSSKILTVKIFSTDKSNSMKMEIELTTMNH